MLVSDKLFFEQTPLNLNSLILIVPLVALTTITQK